MHLHDFLILNIQSFVPLRWEEKILVKIAKCGWRKCLESKYVYAYTKTAKNGRFFCTIPNSPGSVLWQRNKSHCQARKLRCMSSANTEQCIFEKMHYLLQRNSLLGGEGTWQFLHLHNSLPWKLLCSLGRQWTSCDSQPAKHRKIHSVSPFWKCIDLVLCEWKGQRMGEETVALGPTPPPCRLVPLSPEAMVSPPQPVLANQRMPWISDSSFIYHTGEYDIDLLGHCTQQRGFQKPSFLRVLVPFSGKIIASFQWEFP